MTNATVYQGFLDHKKIEKHCSTFNTSSNINEKKSSNIYEKKHRVVQNNKLKRSR